MASTTATPRQTRRTPYLAAVVVGTALSALGAAASVSAAPVATPATVANLSKYCTVCWRNARLPYDSWSDCTQEVFRRLLERLPADAWDRVLRDEADERREFLRAIDTVKKRAQRSKKWSSNLIEEAPDRRQPQARGRAEEMEAVWEAARETLSDRQQRIMQLSFEGWSVHEIGSEMTLPPERVSDEKYKAIRKLRDWLGRDV